MKSKFKKSQMIRSAARRESRQSLFFTVFLGLAAVIIVGFLIVSNSRINQKRAELNAQREYLQQQLQILEAERDQLEMQILESLGEDYLEEEARERFNLKKPGEEVVVVLLPEEEEDYQKKERQWWNPFTW